MPNNSTRAEAIASFLQREAKPDLAASYHAGMEVQVNVARDDGQRAGGDRRRAYTDGINTWYSFRIPKNAWAEPEDNSGLEMTYPLGDHVEGIGMTGWCFRDLRSIYFGYDFDAIVGHSSKHAKHMTDAELASVRDAACAIPWVEVRRSSSGSGLHLYVRLAVHEPTKNHDEHAALARAVLAEMSVSTGFDFDAKVDTCGGNIWVWHRKCRGTNGFELVKPGIPLAQVPAGWRQHVHVARGKRKKVLPEFVPETEGASFDELSGQMPVVKLDDEHQKLIKWLQQNDGWGWWDADHHMLVTHTHHLKRAHEALSLRGPFETLSPGSDLQTQNVFASPLRNGAWVVRRYSRGTAEASTWETDAKGWTRCYLNKDPDLRTAARARGGTETAQGAFAFREAEVAADAVRLLGGKLEIPAGISTRPSRLLPHKDGKRVVVEVDHVSHDSPKGMESWYIEKGKWKTVVVTTAQPYDGEVGIVDDSVRHAVTEGRLDAGWFIKVDDGWNHESKSHTQIALISRGHKKPEVDVLMGASVLKPWMLVARPFEDEYPGDRLWNRSRAQYRYPRSEEIGEFPHWRMIYEHCGAGLNEALAASGWAQANDVKTGAEYLMLWMASVLQDPYAPTPFLFMHGNQDCGKSILHESVDLLITEGLVEANKCLESQERFNAQLEGAVVCVVEEMNLQKNKTAYERIKNWVTSPKITIRKLYIDAYQMPNTTHWIHTANDQAACPIFPGDTRIVVIRVPDLDPGKAIPKPVLMDLLKKEAPHFLNHLLHMEIPPSGSRLAVPVIATSEKVLLANANRTILEQFIEEKTFHVHGEMILFADFYDRFRESIDAIDAQDWSRYKISKSLPTQHPVGKRGGDTYIGNISWIAPQPGATVRPRLVLKDRCLVPIA